MRQRATRGQILVSIGLVIAVLLAGFWWWPHIVWSFQVARHGVKIPSVPVGQMPVPGKTADWSNCRLGPMSLKLPAQIADEAERTAEKNQVVLTAGEQQIAINVPFRVPPKGPNDLSSVAAQLNLTPMRLLEESYRASTDKFRWTMSRAELRRHQLLINLAAMFPHGGGRGASEVETRFDKDIEGLLIVYDDQHASFEFRTASDAGAGYVMFIRKSGNLDLDFVRDVCQSISCDEARLVPEYGKKELQQMLDAMETGPQNEMTNDE